MVDQACEEKWLDGGGRSVVLKFQCQALSEHQTKLPAEILKMTFKTFHAETKLLSALLSAHGFCEVGNDCANFNILWTGVHPKPQVFRMLAPHQRLNHFPRSSELTRKDRLYKNIEMMQYLKGVKHFDFIPQSFIMPAEYKEFMSAHHRVKGPWIVKPVASSRGRGIYIVNSPDEVAMEESLVVAKYIDNPLLICGHKCDLRLYVAVTSYDPLVAYMYEEGLVRFAAVPYDMQNNSLWNPCMHLCNYSINKHHTDYIKSDSADIENVGHKWTLSALLRYLRSKEVDTAILMQKIEETVIKSLLASSSSIITACKLFVPHHSNCFELYGFDLLIDERLKPWLLEVNLSPSLACDSPLDTKVKSALLADLLTLVGVPAVDPNVKPPPPKQPKLSSNSIRVGSAATLPAVKKFHPANSSGETASGSSTGVASSSNPVQNSSNAQTLTNEESKIVTSVRSQFNRRGGFIRIFPTPNTWRTYSKYLDPLTGLPGYSVETRSKKRNLNYLLYRSIFEEPVRSTTGSSDERINRYERILTKGHTVCLTESTVKQDEDLPCDVSQVNAIVLKQQVLECLQEGFKFSQIQARLVFAQYLKCVLRKMSGSGNKMLKRQKIDETHLELVVKFLQRAASNFRTPRPLKIPNRNMSTKDRMAMIAKQLSDFLYEYSRETESMDQSVCKSTSETVPEKLFSLFLTAAQEGDLEDVLLLSTQLYKSSKLFLGKCYGNRQQKTNSSSKSETDPKKLLLWDHC